MKDAPPFFRPLDGVLLLVILVVAGVSLFRQPDEGPVRSLAVLVDGRWVKEIPLVAGGAEHVIRGARGDCRFRFDEEGCQMLASPCPMKHCLRQGKVKVAGRAVVCLPNRVALVLRGHEDESLDGISR